jgi:hypothetical protein
MPDKKPAKKGDKCKSGGNSKEKEVLLAASGTGEKLSPCVTNKANVPRRSKKSHCEPFASYLQN